MILSNFHLFQMKGEYAYDKRFMGLYSSRYTNVKIIFKWKG